LKNVLNLPMHTARIPPVDPAPATIAAALAMHTGHIMPSFTLLICGFPFDELRVAGLFDTRGISVVAPAASLRSRHNLVLCAHEINLAWNVEMQGVTSVAGFQSQQRAGSTWTR
jgi:hypothetical protein